MRNQTAREMLAQLGGTVMQPDVEETKQIRAVARAIAGGIVLVVVAIAGCEMHTQRTKAQSDQLAVEKGYSQVLQADGKTVLWVAPKATPAP